MRIHLTGASGSGTTTLGSKLAQHFEIPFIDSDDVYWIQPENPDNQASYTLKRSPEERHELIHQKIADSDQWVIAGSMTSWGQPFWPQFTHVIFMHLPWEVRKERLIQRELKLFGKQALEPNGIMHKNHVEFLEWASRYDTAGPDQRSRVLHDLWLKKISCPILKIEQEIDLDELFHICLDWLSARH